MQLGKTISTIRKQNNIKQKDLAEKCGLSVSALNKIENTKTDRPNPKTIQIVAEKLGVSEGLLYFMAMEDSDVPAEKRDLFRAFRTIFFSPNAI